MEFKGFNLFKIEKSKQPANPFSQEGVKALVIVLVAISLISAIVYFSKIFCQSRESSIISPTPIEVETTPQLRLTLIEIPTVTPSATGGPTATGTGGLTATPTEVPVEVPTEEPMPEETPASPAGRPTILVSPTVTE